ncbi:hypothetical protein C8R44DRAFT_736353 [Mycena epipterygia]|nr:hypothetical protein C8R44DRAFT_736353 [Mycena epipterygia]
MVHNGMQGKCSARRGLNTSAVGQIRAYHGANRARGLQRNDAALAGIHAAGRNYYLPGTRRSRAKSAYMHHGGPRRNTRWRSNEHLDENAGCERGTTAKRKYASREGKYCEYSMEFWRSEPEIPVAGASRASVASINTDEEEENQGRDGHPSRNKPTRSKNMQFTVSRRALRSGKGQRIGAECAGWWNTGRGTHEEDRTKESTTANLDVVSKRQGNTDVAGKTSSQVEGVWRSVGGRSRDQRYSRKEEMGDVGISCAIDFGTTSSTMQAGADVLGQLMLEVHRDHRS